jgi:S-formylglutathione hydrolase
MRQAGYDGPILVDTGTDDQFFDLLGTQAFASASIVKRANTTIRLQEGYDHSYFFVSTFMEDHITFHANALYA